MSEPKTEIGRRLKAVLSPLYPEPLTVHELSDNEKLDRAVDVFARRLIQEVVENYLADPEMRTHDLMTDVNWRRCRDRIYYILSEMAPEEGEHQDAWRLLTDG